MLTRKRLLTAVMCGGLLSVGGVADRVSASSLLQPDSDWAVSKLASSQTGGSSYCALARRFNNNLILTIARNARDESSVAIDFQKTALNNSQSYNVELNPGFGQNRVFNVRPVSGKALVIRLGQDYAFHDALNRSGQLALNIAGEAYNFNLQDFADGQKKLSECLVTIVEPASGNNTASAAMTPPPPAPQRHSIIPVSDTSAPAATAATAAPVSSGPDIQALREENIRLRNALERERRLYEDRLMHESQSSSVAAELKERVRILEMENGQLRDQLAYQPAPEPVSCPAPDTSTVNSLEDQIAVLRDENMRLEQNLAAQKTEYALLQKQTGDSQGLEGDMSALRAENLRLKQDLATQKVEYQLLEKELAEAAKPDEAREAVMARLQERVNRLEEENEELKTARDSAGEGGGTPVSLAQLRSVEEQLRYVQNDRDRLLAQIDAASNGQAQDRLNISSDNWNLEQATRRFNEAEREIRRLGRELEKQRTQCAMQKKELEYMLFDPEVAEEEQISRLMELESQNAQFDDRLASLQEDKADYQQQLALLEKELADIETAAGEAEKTMAEMARIQVENEALKEERARLTEQKNSLSERIAILESGLASVETASSRMESEQVASLSQQNESLRAEKDRLSAQKTALTEQIANLESELTAAKTAASRIDSREMAALKQENASLREKHSRLTTEKAALSDRIAVLENDLASMALAAERNAPDLAAASGQIARLEAENEGLQQEKERLIQQKNVLSQQMASLENTLAGIPSGAGRTSTPPPVAAEAVVIDEAYTGAGSAYNGYEPQPISYQQDSYRPSAEPAVIKSDSKGASGSASDSGEGRLISASVLQDILKQAHIPVQSPVEQIEGSAEQGFAAYSWDAGALYGSAEQQAVASMRQFDELVSDYLNQTKNRCQGDFASVPIMEENKGDIRVSSYEIACISGQGGAAASIVFFNKSGTFTTIAHETGIENMDAAMDARDSLTEMLLNSRVAFN